MNIESKISEHFKPPGCVVPKNIFASLERMIEPWPAEAKLLALESSIEKNEKIEKHKTDDHMSDGMSKKNSDGGKALDIAAAGIKPNKQQNVRKQFNPFRASNNYDLVITFEPQKMRDLHGQWVGEKTVHEIIDLCDEESKLSEEDQRQLLKAMDVANGKQRVLVICNGGNNRSRLLACLIRIDRGLYSEDASTDPVQDYFKAIVHEAAKLGGRHGVEHALRTVEPSRKRRS